MRRLRVNAICTAAVRETWLIEVPDDFDPTAVPEDRDLIDHAMEVGRFVRCDDVAFDETDRDVEGHELLDPAAWVQQARHRHADQTRTADDDLRAAVASAREAGLSWADVGSLLGVSRQAAWERFH